MSESQHQRSPEHQPSSLDALTAALEEAAERLRAGEIEREEAAALVERCAELAAEEGAELERIAQGTADYGPGADPPRQERLL